MGNNCCSFYGDDAFGKHKELPAEERDTTQDLPSNTSLRAYKEKEDRQTRARKVEEIDYKDRSNNIDF